MNNYKIGIIGLGYVGLPLAVEFARKYPTIGFDINQSRVKELNSGHDKTLEVDDDYLKSVLSDDIIQVGLFNTADFNSLKGCNIFIITVPTPTDKNNRPVLTPLYKASETVGNVLKKNDIVIYESTVYPGVTEDECVPVLEKNSGLKFNTDFFVGYSPERINPGDKLHTVTKIKKVTSGSTPEIGEKVDALYREVIEAGTHLAPSIKVAEASKVIENSQRDINIAFVNELSLIFNRLGVDTLDVLEAASTKWNFLPFKPGLVGGHCIGVDPYYLAQKAQEVGYHSEIILAGRRLNDGMGRYIASDVIKAMISKGIKIPDSKILIAGFTFKENCPDIRNTKVVDIYKELESFGAKPSVYDPWVDKSEVFDEYNLEPIEKPTNKYDAIILAVAHSEFKLMNLDKLRAENSVIYDVKGVLPRNIVDRRL